MHVHTKGTIDQCPKGLPHLGLGNRKMLLLFLFWTIMCDFCFLFPFLLCALLLVHLCFACNEKWGFHKNHCSVDLANLFIKLPDWLAFIGLQ